MWLSVAVLLLPLSNAFRTDERIMYVDVPTEGVRTLYARFGDWFAWLSVAGFMCLAGKARSGKGPENW